MALLNPPAPVKGVKDKQNALIKFDNKKPIIALAAHPSAAQLIMQFAPDGSVSSASLSDRGLALVWTIPGMPL